MAENEDLKNLSTATPDEVSEAINAETTVSNESEGSSELPEPAGNSQMDVRKLPGYSETPPEIPPTGQIDYTFWNDTQVQDAQGNSVYYNSQTLDEGIDLDQFKSTTFVKGLDEGFTYTGFDSTWERSQEAQGKMGKLANGAVRFVGDTMFNVAQGFVMFGGAASALAQGEMSKLFDNDVANYLDETQAEFDKIFGIKRGGEQSFLDSATNVFAEDILGAASFLAGAVVSETIMAAMTAATMGGTAPLLAANTASIAARGARLMKGILNGAKALKPARYLDDLAKSGVIGGRAAAPAAARTMTRQAVAEGIEQGVKQTGKQKLSAAARQGRQLLTGAGFEAGVEARHMLNEAVEDHKREYEAVNGVGTFTEEMAEQFREKIQPHANAVFGANLALVGYSNMLMFPKIFGAGAKSAIKMPRFIDTSSLTPKQVKRAMKALDITDASKLPKIIDARRVKGAGRIYRNAAPLRTALYEGAVEEGLQGVFSSSTKEYIADMYDPAGVEQTANYVGNFFDAFSEQYTSAEGLKEIGLGMLMGFTGLPNVMIGNMVKYKNPDGSTYTPRFIGGMTETKQQMAQEDEMANRIIHLHEKNGDVNAILRNEIQHSITQANLAQRFNEALANGDFKTAKDIEADQIFAHATSKIFTGRKEDAKSEYKQLLDEMSDEEYRELLGPDGINMSASELQNRKQQVYENYVKRMDAAEKSYQRAKNIYKGDDVNIHIGVSHLLYNIEDRDRREKAIADGIARKLNNLTPNQVIAATRLREQAAITDAQIEELQAAVAAYELAQLNRDTSLEQGEIQALKQKKEQIENALRSQAKRAGVYNYDAVRFNEDLQALDAYHTELKQAGLEMAYDETIDEDSMDLHLLQMDRMKMIAQYEDLLKEGGVERFFAAMQDSVQARMLMSEDEHNKRARAETLLADEQDKKNQRDAEAQEPGAEPYMEPDIPEAAINEDMNDGGADGGEILDVDGPEDGPIPPDAGADYQGDQKPPEGTGEEDGGEPDAPPGGDGPDGTEQGGTNEPDVEGTEQDGNQTSDNAGSVDNRYGLEGELQLKEIQVAEEIGKDEEGNPIVGPVRYNVFRTSSTYVVVVNYQGASLPFFYAPNNQKYSDGFYPFVGYAKDGSMIGHVAAKEYFNSDVLQSIAHELNDRLSEVIDGTNDVGVLSTNRQTLRAYGINSNEGLRLPNADDVNFQTYVRQAAYEFLQTIDQDAANAFQEQYGARKPGENNNEKQRNYVNPNSNTRTPEATGNGGWRQKFSPNWDADGGLRLRGAAANGGGNMDQGATDALLNGMENGELTVVPNGQNVEIMYNGQYIGRLDRAMIERTEGVDQMEDGRRYQLKVKDVVYRKGVRPSRLRRDEQGRPIKKDGKYQYEQVRYSLQEIFDTEGRKNAIMDVATVRLPKGVPTIQGFTTGEVYDWPSDTAEAHKRLLVGRTVVMFKDANGKEHFMIAEMPQAGPDVANAMWYAIQTARVVSGVATAEEVGMNQQAVDANVRSLQEMYGLSLIPGDAQTNSDAVYGLISNVLGYQNDDSQDIHTSTQRRSGEFVEGVTEAWRFGSDLTTLDKPFQYILHDHNNRADTHGRAMRYDALDPKRKDVFINLMSRRQLNLSYNLVGQREQAGLPIGIKVDASGAITYSDLRPAFDWVLSQGTNAIAAEVKGPTTVEGSEALRTMIERRGNVPLQVVDENGNDALVFDFPFSMSLEVDGMTPVPTDAEEQGQGTDGLTQEELLKRAQELENDEDDAFYSPSALSDEVAPADDGINKGELSEEEDAEMVADLYRIAGMSSKNVMDAINVVRGRLAAEIIKHNMSATRKDAMTANDMAVKVMRALEVELNNLKQQREVLQKAGKSTAKTDSAISQFEILFQGQNFQKVARLAMVEIISHTQGVRVADATSITDAFSKLGMETAVNENADSVSVGSVASEVTSTEELTTDEDNRDEAEQEEFKVFEDSFTFTVDPNDTMGKELRLRLMTLKEPETHPGNQTVFGSSPEQQRAYVDYKLLQTQVLNAVSNYDYSHPDSRHYNYKSLAKILEAQSDVYPGLKALLTALDDTVQLDKDPKANAWKIGKRQLLQVQLVRFAAKQSAEFLNYKLRDKRLPADDMDNGRPSTTYQFSTNEQGLNEFAVTQMFQGLVSRGYFTYTDAGQLEHNQEKFKEILDKMDAIVQAPNKTAEDKARIMAAMLSVNLGITVAPSVFTGNTPSMPWNKVRQELAQTRRSETLFGSMRSFFMQGAKMSPAEAKAAQESASKTTTARQLPVFDSDIMSRNNKSAVGLRKFAGLAAANSKQLVQNTSRDAKGNLRQQFIAPKMITERLKDVRSNPSIYTQELNGNMLYNILRGRNVTDARNLMKIDYYGGIMNYDNPDRMKEFHDMEMDDRSLAQFLAFINNGEVSAYAGSKRTADGKMVKNGRDKMTSKHFLPTLSDKSAMPMITVPQMDFTLAVPEKFKDGFYAGLRNLNIRDYVNVEAIYSQHIKHIVNSELKRIKEARTQNSDTVSTLTAAQRQAKGFIMLPKLNQYLPDGHISIEVEQKLHKEAENLIAQGLTRNLSRTLVHMDGSVIEYDDQKNTYKFEYIKPSGGNIGKGKKNAAGMVIRNLTGLSDKELSADKSKARQMDALAATVAHFVTQDYVVNTNAVQLFAGELGVYHKKEGATLEETAHLTLNNVGKRFAAWIAPGNVLPEVEWKSRGTLRSNKTYNIMAIKDKVSKAGNYEYLEKLGLTKEQLAAYEEIDATDGAEFVHYEEHLAMLYAEGKMDRRMFEGLLKRCHNIMDGTDTRPLDIEELAFFQPVKPVTAGIRNGQLTYIKSAQFPLVPDVTRMSEMNKLLQFMDKNNVQRAVHLSAYKAGSPFGKNPHKGPEALNIYGEDGAIEIDEDKAKEVIVRDIPRHFMRVQQEVPVGRTKEKTHGSQAAKLFMSGLSTIESGFVVWTPEGMKDMSGRGLYQHYMDARRDELEARSEMFAEQMGLEYVDGQFRVTPKFKEKLGKRLVKEGLARNYEVNEIAELQYNPATGEFLTPLWATANTDRINSLMRSLYRKAVIKPMMMGFSGPIRPEAGIKEMTVEDLTESQLNSIAYVVDANGKRKWDGKKLRVSEEGKPDQILLPWKFAGKMKDFMDKDGNIDMSRVPEELLQVFAYRIPGQKKASSGSFEIVGFLPPSMGDTLIVPEELVGRVGQDYDIDKMFGMMYEHRVIKGKDGKKRLQIIREDNTDKPTARSRQAMARNRQLDSYHASIRNPDPRVQRMLHTPVSNGYSEAVISNLDLASTAIHNALPYSLDYNHLKAENARSGKRSIGVFATHGVLHAQLNSVGVSPRIAKLYGVELKSNAVLLPRSRGGKVLDNVDRLGKDALIDTSFMSDIVADPETMTVQEQFSVLINHAVDNESDQLLEKLGINEETWFIWTGLTHMGYNMETIAMFVRQDIVQDFINRVAEGKSIASKTSGKPSRVLDEMFEELVEVVMEPDRKTYRLEPQHRVYPNKKDMYDKVVMGSTAMNAEQQQFFDWQLLRDLSKLQSLDTSLSSMVQALKFDTRSPASQLELDIQLAKAASFTKAQVQGDDSSMAVWFEDNDWFKTLNNTVAGQIYLKLLDTAGVMNLEGESLANTEVYQWLVKNAEQGRIRNPQGVLKGIRMYAHIKAAEVATGRSAYELRAELMLDKNTNLVKQIHDLAAKYPEVANNPFLKLLLLKPATATNPIHLIEFNGTKQLDTMSVDANVGFLALTQSKNPEVRKLAQNLVLYSMINGHVPAGRSFAKYVPAEFREQVAPSSVERGMTKEMGELNSDSVFNPFGMLTQIMAANPDFAAFQKVESEAVQIDKEGGYVLVPEKLVPIAQSGYVRLGITKGKKTTTKLYRVAEADIPGMVILGPVQLTTGSLLVEYSSVDPTQNTLRRFKQEGGQVRVEPTEGAEPYPGDLGAYDNAVEAYTPSTVEGSEPFQGDIDYTDMPPLDAPPPSDADAPFEDYGGMDWNVVDSPSADTFAANEDAFVAQARDRVRSGSSQSVDSPVKGTLTFDRALQSLFPGNKAGVLAEFMADLQEQLPSDVQPKVRITTDPSEVTNYNRETNVITFNPNLSKKSDLVHEMTHALTLQAIANKSTMPRGVQMAVERLEKIQQSLQSDSMLKAMGVDPEQYKQFRRGNAVYRRLAAEARRSGKSLGILRNQLSSAERADLSFFLNQENRDKMYGLTNVAEMVAETLTNPQFAEQLNKIKRQTNQTWLQRMMELVRDILSNLMPNVNMNSLAAEVVENSVKVMKGQARQQGKASLDNVKVEGRDSRLKSLMEEGYKEVHSPSSENQTIMKSGDVEVLRQYKKKRIEELEELGKRFKGSQRVGKIVNQQLERERRELRMLLDDSVALEMVLDMADRELTTAEELMSNIDLTRNNLEYVQSRLQNVYSMVEFYERFRGMVSPSSDTRTQLRDIQGRAANLREDWFDISSEVLRQYAKQKFKGTPLEAKVNDETFRIMDDIGALGSLFQDASRMGRVELSYLDMVIREANERQQARFNEMYKEYMAQSKSFKASSFFKKYGFEGIMEVNADGKPTNRLINPVSPKFYEDSAKLYEEARRSGDYTQYNKWRKENTINLDVSQLYEATANGYRRKENPVYMLKLEKEMGKEVLREVLARQDKAMQDYHDRRQAQIDIIEMDTIGEIDRERKLREWEATYSPFMHYRYSTGRTRRPQGARNLFLKVAPKAVANGQETGYVDSRYIELTKDAEALAYYNYTRQLMRDMTAMLPATRMGRDAHLWQNGLMLPAIRRTLMEEVKSSSNKWDTLSSAAMAAITSSDEELEATTIDPVTGEPRTQLPTYFIKNLPKGENVETDLDRSIGAFMIMATTFDARNEVEDIVAMTSAVMNSHKMQIAHTNGMGQRIKNRFGKDIGMSSVQSKSNVSRSVQAVTNEFYGRRAKKMGSSAIGRQAVTQEQKQKKKVLKEAMAQLRKDLDNNVISELEYQVNYDALKKEYDETGQVLDVGKVLRQLMQFVQLKGMGWNIAGAVTNTAFGTVSVMRHAEGQTDFTPTEARKAQAIMLHSTLNHMSLNTGYTQTETAGKILAMMTNLDVLKDFTEVRYDPSKAEAGGNQRKGLSKLRAYEIQRSSEYFVYGQGVVAKLLATKVDGKSLWEHMDKDGVIQLEGYRPGEQKFFELRRSVDQMNKLIHGNYDPNSPIAIKQTLLGPLLMQFRTWLPEAAAQRFGKEVYDPYLGRMVKGTYRTMFSRSTLGELGLKVIPLMIPFYARRVQIEGLSKVDEENVRKFMATLRHRLQVALLILFLKSLKDDEDDENNKRLLNFGLNIARRVETDISFFGNAGALSRILQEPMAVLGLAKDVDKITEAAWLTLLGDDEIPTGIYAGDNRLWHHTMRLPVLNAVRRQVGIMEQEYNT